MLLLNKIFIVVYIYTSSARVVEETHGDAQYQGTGCYICELWIFFRSSTSFCSESPFYHVPYHGSLHLPGYPTVTTVLRVTIQGACVQMLATVPSPSPASPPHRCRHKRSAGELKATFWPFYVPEIRSHS